VGARPPGLMPLPGLSQAALEREDDGRLAVWVWRSKARPRWLAALLFLSVPIGVGFAEQGGSVVTAILWCAVGALLLRQPPR